MKNILTEEKKEYFKELLTARLEELVKGASEAVSTAADMSEESPDIVDQASLESDRDFTFRIKEREGKLINKIKEALQRIENGTYGICEVCKREISEERLNARPVTTLCIRCKKKQEAKEKARGD